VYTLPVTVTQAGTATVSISKNDCVFNPSSKEVPVSVKQVAFSSLVANGNASTATTTLTILLDQAVPGLTADDITVSGAGAAKNGALGGAGPLYTLPITVRENGTVTATIAKAGFSFVPPSRQTGVYARQVAFVSVVPNGNADTTTTALTITLDQVVPGLTADDIIITGNGIAKNGAITGAGPVYTLPVSVTLGEMFQVSVSKVGFEFTPAYITTTAFYVSTGYTYPPARELYMGVSTTSNHASPAAHAEGSGRIRWYVNSYLTDPQQIGTAHTGAPIRTALTSAQFLIIEYPTAPPSGRTLILSIDAQGSWGHTYAQANALPTEHKVVVTTDGTSRQFVFDLRAPYTKSAQTGASAFSNTSTSYGLTINISTNMTNNAATRAWLANSRTS